MTELRLPTLGEIRVARDLIADSTLQIPLVPLNVEDLPFEIFLKLENLQAIGSYKARGAGNVILTSSQSDLRKGVVTLSAGNLGQGVAWYARKLGIPCVAIVPDHAPEAKTNALVHLGAEVRRIPYAKWWAMMESGKCDGYPGVFIHPAFDVRLMAGHGTIGLEIAEQMPDVDAILVPFGGGAMISGIAVAARSLCPGVQIHACEVETAAPLAAAIRCGGPTEIDYVASFVDGIGSKSVLPEVWNQIKNLVTSSIVVSLAQVENAIRVLFKKHHVIAEGAGGAALAAGMLLDGSCKKVVCVISGGNLDFDQLARLMKE